MPSRGKVFFGWWTSLTAGLVELWSAGYYLYGISVFFKPIAAELGLDRAVTSVASSIGRFEGGLEGPVAGWACDRYGPRRVVLCGVTAAALGLLLMFYVNSFLAFVVVWGVIQGTGRNFASGVPTDTAISNWFVKKRGVALSVKWVLAGLSGVITLSLIAWLMDINGVNLGWRNTCLLGGVILLLFGIPLVWFFIRDHRPEYYGLMPDGARVDDPAAGQLKMIESGMKYAADSEEVEFSAKQAFRTRTYWLLVFAQGLNSLSVPVMQTHLIPFLTDIDFDPVWAAAMMSIMVGVGLPARFVGGFVADRIRRDRLRFLQGSVYLLQASGMAIFVLRPTVEMIYAWLLVYGLGYGATHTLNPLLFARYFGRKAYGSIRGTATMCIAPVSMAAPIYAGWVYDTTGSYMDAFTLLVIVLLISGLTMCLIVPPKSPADTSDSGGGTQAPIDLLRSPRRSPFPIHGRFGLRHRPSRRSIGFSRSVSRPAC